MGNDVQTLLPIRWLTRAAVVKFPFVDEISFPFLGWGFNLKRKQKKSSHHASRFTLAHSSDRKVAPSPMNLLRADINYSNNKLASKQQQRTAQTKATKIFVINFLSQFNSTCAKVDFFFVGLSISIFFVSFGERVKKSLKDFASLNYFSMVVLMPK